MTSVYYSAVTHRGKHQILVKFEFDETLNNQMRKRKDAVWSNSLKGWLLPDTEAYRAQCGMDTTAVAALKEHLPAEDKSPKDKQLKEIKTVPDKNAGIARTNKSSVVQSSFISAHNRVQLDHFIQHLTLKAYSPSTIKTYRNEFMAFLQTIKHTDADSFTSNRLKDYLEYCFTVLKLSENTLHSRMNALKFYYEQVLRKDKFFWEIPRPKKRVQLPHFFNQDEIAAIIKAVGNTKHKTMLMLAYSGGLRVSEVVQLKTKNIDSKRMTIRLDHAKGKKDRIIVLSPLLLIMLREYWNEYKPHKDGYLFTGQEEGAPYSSRSLQEIIAAAKAKAGIVKPGSIHALRHSFATHLLDKGTDIIMIQKLLGHNDLKTTLRYLHVTNRDMLKVISPLDDLNLE